MACSNVTRVFFKIRLPDANVDWHELPYKGFRRYGGSLGLQTANASNDAKRLANGLQAEVRWNFEGSLQGHYVGPDPMPELHPMEGVKYDPNDDEVKV